MVRSRDYYSVLGVPRSADAAEIKRAYREQALQHHPDKNPDRLQEATEQFQLIGEAYTVLRDPEQRAAYDRGGHAEGAVVAQSHRQSGDGESDGGFSVEKARDLFRDVFGDDFTAMLSAAATATSSSLGVVGDRVSRSFSRSSVVHRAVAPYLSHLTDEAESDAAAKALVEDACRERHDAAQKALEEYQAFCLKEWQARRERKISWWEALKRKVMRQTKMQRADAAFDFRAAYRFQQLRREVREATFAWCKSLEDAGDAEDHAFVRQRTEETIQSEGVSFLQAKEAGKHSLGRLARKFRWRW